MPAIWRQTLVPGRIMTKIKVKKPCKCTNSKYHRPVPRKKPKIGSETFTSVWVHGYLDVSLMINCQFNKIIGISRRVDCLLYISFTVAAVRLKKIVYYSANLTQTPLNPRNPDPLTPGPLTLGRMGPGPCSRQPLSGAGRPWY